jgi:hypothetical protein
MRTHVPSLTPDANRGIKGFYNDIIRFFFQPSDTATLGLIRLCAGFLILWVHAVYSYQLYDLFGKDAWINADLANDIRKNYPIMPTSLSWYGPAWYEVTDTSLAKLTHSEVPEATVRELRPLMGTKYHSYEEFQAALKTTLTKDEVFRYEFSITSVSQIPVEYPTPTPDEAKAINEYKNDWLKADEGVDPRQLYTRGMYVWSVWFHVTDPTWIAIIHVGILLCMLLFALGLWTPGTGLVTWLGMLSYVNRASTTFFGMDTIMNVLVLYLTLAHLFARPGTAALSLDRLLWRWRKARQGGTSISAVGGDTMSVSANFAIRMMQIHFCIIYLGSGLSKLMGSAWWNGTAIWGTLANPEFSALHLKFYYEMITWLARHRVLWELSMTGGAAFTLALEIGFPFLVWNRRLRWLMVIGSVLLHTGIALFMGLVGFSLMMLALLVSFIPPSAVRQLLGLADRVPALVPAAPRAPTPVAAGRA